MKFNSKFGIAAAAVWLCWSLAASAADEAAGAAEPVQTTPAVDPAKTFAQVGDTVITVGDFLATYNAEKRKKYYHAVPPPDEAAKLQREIGENLISNALVNQEAKRRGYQPDKEAVQQLLDGFDRQYADREDWKKIREEMLPKMRLTLEAQSRRDKMEKEVRGKVPAQPSAAELEQYYEAHLELFTEPQKVRARLILLGVEPSAARDVWNKALEEAQGIAKKVKEGADFGELARLHSSHQASAEEGGDLGYLHGGMLPPSAQGVVDKLQAGEMSEPFRGLEGVYLVRVEDRKEKTLRTLDEVRQRAAELWHRDATDRAWKGLLAELRKTTPVTVDESNYLPMPPPAENK